jgi:ABC-type Na+ efflux pump permease subunit
MEFRAAFAKDLRSYVRYPAWVVGEFISTPLWFFFFALGVTLFAPTSATSFGAGGLSYFFFGFVFIILFSTAVWGIGQTVRNEQTAGTLEQFLLAPASPFTLIIGRWARIFLTDMLVIGYSTLFVYLLEGSLVTLSDPAAFVFSIALFEVALIGFGLLFAGLTMRIKSYNTVSNLVFFGYMSLTEALFPIEIIPIPARYLSLVIPFTYFNDLIRHAALATPTILPEAIEYVVAGIMSVLMLALGFFAFGRIVKHARASGTISTS